MSPEAIVRVDTVRNLLVMMGTRTQAEGWMDLVNTFDVDLLKGMSVGVFPLKYASVKEVEVALRPEQVVLGAPVDGSAAAVVLHSDYFGHDVLVHAQLDDGSTVMSRVVGGIDLPAPGQRVGVTVTGPVLAYPLT